MNNKIPQLQEEAVKRQRIYRIIGLIVLAIILIFILYRIEQVGETVSWFADILQPIFWGVGMAYLLNPVLIFFEARFHRFFSKYDKTKKREKGLTKFFSIFITVILAIVLLVSLLLLIIPEFLKSLQKLIDIIPAQLAIFTDWLDIQKVSENVLLRNLGELLQSAVDYFNQWLKTYLDTSIKDILSIATNSVISVLMFVINFFIAIVVTVYTLMDKKRLIGQLKKFLVAILPKKSVNALFETARHGHTVFGKFLSGKIITSSFLGLISFIIMSIFSIPYALLVSVIVAFTNIIPFFGPFIGGIPSALIILLTDVNKGIIFIIMIVILQQIEGNIVTPRILGIRTGMSEFWVTFSLLLFGGLFGFVGMIVAVPLFAVIIYMIEMYVNGRLERKNLPTDSNLYLKIDGVNDSGLIISNEDSKPQSLEHKKPFFKSFLNRFKSKKK